MGCNKGREQRYGKKACGYRKGMTCRGGGQPSEKPRITGTLTTNRHPQGLTLSKHAENIFGREPALSSHTRRDQGDSTPITNHRPLSRFAALNMQQCETV
jgi:hypothetical protein